MTLRVHLDPPPHSGGDTASFATGQVVRVGRGSDNDVVIGREHVRGQWTVSKSHAELRWDGERWSTGNVSDKPGLLTAYEPGYGETPVEPGRWWSPVGGRWSIRLGRSTDSTRKAVERINAKITGRPGAPTVATGRNVSAEIGRRLAPSGLLGP